MRSTPPKIEKNAKFSLSIFFDFWRRCVARRQKSKKMPRTDERTNERTNDLRFSIYDFEKLSPFTSFYLIYFSLPHHPQRSASLLDGGLALRVNHRHLDSFICLFVRSFVRSTLSVNPDDRAAKRDRFFPYRPTLSVNLWDWTLDLTLDSTLDSTLDLTLATPCYARF